LQEAILEALRALDSDLPGAGRFSTGILMKCVGRRPTLANRAAMSRALDRLWSRGLIEGKVFGLPRRPGNGYWWRIAKPKPSRRQRRPAKPRLLAAP
jgi:hypothetical protein